MPPIGEWEWQEWVFVGMCIAAIPLFYLIVKGKLTKARPIVDKNSKS
jgi:hypothetical protein